MLNKGLVSIKRHVRNFKLYVVAYEIKEVLKKHLNNNRAKMISLEPEEPSRGYVLFSYVIDAFLSEASQTAPYSHPAYWESLQMAKTFLEFGYRVDVISAIDAAEFTPKKNYDFFIGHRYNFVKIAERLNKDCVKVLHCDLAHPLFHNAANCARMLALQQRKGITLPMVKFDWPTQAIEHADCATVLGNGFTISTYTYADKPIYRIPISAPFLYSWPERKDFEACRRHFLWFGSDGFVHKGLDLVLDAFAEMPDYHLTVCGPIGQEIEKDFEKAFYKELYQTANIRTLGWVDVGSPEFVKIAADCVGLIYPSCSEGQSGGVVTCMHAGLIPILSYESGVDVDDFGFLLQGSSVESIRDSIRMVASLPAQELKERARRAWEFARANHTREKFTEEYRKFVVTMASDFGHRLDCVDRSHKSLDNPAHYAASTNVE